MCIRDRIRIGEKHNIEIIATNDSHYISNMDVESHDALLCVLTGKLISDQKRLRYTGTEYIKSENEMLSLFKDHIDEESIKKAVNNTVEISKKIEEFELFGTYRMPKFPLKEDFDSLSLLTRISNQGLLKRLKKSCFEEVSEIYKKRLSSELRIINDMGFPDYFLFVWEIVFYLYYLVLSLAGCLCHWMFQSVSQRNLQVIYWHMFYGSKFGTILLHVFLHIFKR